MTNDHPLPLLGLMPGDATGIGPEQCARILADNRMKDTAYHDQGQIATKHKGFNRGVTVTAGLATLFTTPAHGTAFDIEVSHW
jgi:4-hydroxy-L-threonine phosphate dehydrogenase PdxA